MPHTLLVRLLCSAAERHELSPAEQGGAWAYTLKGSLGSDVNVILKDTLGLDLHRRERLS